MILGLGIDLISHKRFQRALDRHGERLLRRFFTARERAECRVQDAAALSPARLERLAARFAAKEAAMKALGTGWTLGVRWIDLEVTLDAHGAPKMTLHGLASDLANARGVSAVHVSLTHDGGQAAAVVLLWGGTAAPTAR